MAPIISTRGTLFSRLLPGGRHKGLHLVVVLFAFKPLLEVIEDKYGPRGQFFSVKAMVRGDGRVRRDVVEVELYNPF